MLIAQLEHGAGTINQVLAGKVRSEETIREQLRTLRHRILRGTFYTMSFNSILCHQLLSRIGSDASAFVSAQRETISLTIIRPLDLWNNVLNMMGSNGAFSMQGADGTNALPHSRAPCLCGSLLCAIHGGPADMPDSDTGFD